jgi:hypothetical protein
LINGKPVKEEGIMGEFNKSGARIIEVSGDKSKYTELTPGDIEKIISIRSSPDGILQRLSGFKHSKKRHYTHHHRKHHHTRRGHMRGHSRVARGHTKKRRKKKKRKTRKKHHKKRK